MAKLKNESDKMNLLDDPEETEDGMLLSALADGPGEAESAMLLNSLVDDPEELKEDADRLIWAVDKVKDHPNLFPEK